MTNQEGKHTPDSINELARKYEDTHNFDGVYHAFIAGANSQSSELSKLRESEQYLSKEFGRLSDEVSILGYDKTKLEQEIVILKIERDLLKHQYEQASINLDAKDKELHERQQMAGKMGIQLVEYAESNRELFEALTKAQKLISRDQPPKCSAKKFRTFSAAVINRTWRTLPLKTH